MRKIPIFVFILPIIIALNGCVVHSLEPFFTAENKIEMPASIVGEWLPVTLEGDDVSGKGLTSWKFGNDSVLCYDKKNLSGNIDVIFFKVNNGLFCDTQAGSPDNTVINQYWIFHLYSFHTLCKVVQKDDTLTFIPLNLTWIDEKVRSGTVEVPFIEWKNEETILFTASPEQWEGFIKEHGSDPELFSREHMFVLKRKKGKAGYSK